jgi:transposase-like protein
MTQSRRTFTAQEKLTAVRRYLVDKVPVSDLSDCHLQQPTQIYQWQKLLFENGEAAFTKSSRKTKADDAKDKRIEALESKIQLKNELVAELLQGHVQLKKNLQLKSIDDARAEVSRYVKHYNEVRLHSAIGYVTPHTKLAGAEKAVLSARDRKLESDREARRLRRQPQAA